MREERIRQQLLEIKEKWHTPNSCIARDIKLDDAIVTKFLNDKLGYIATENILSRLEKWINERM